MASSANRFVRTSLTLALVLMAGSAVAAPPSAAERETARRLMDTGRTETQGGNLMNALDAYKKAHEIMHVPTTGLALAKTHRDLGHLVEARDVAREVTRIPEDPSEPPVFKVAREEARQLDADLKARIPALIISAKGASKVTLDGNEVPKTLLDSPSAINPGKHAVVAFGADGSEKKMDFEVHEKETKTVELATGDGRAYPLPGAHKAGTDGSPGDARTPLATGLIYGGFGVGAVGIVVGAVTGILTLSKASDVKSQCSGSVCPPAVEDDLSSSKSTATISTIGFAVGGAGIAAGVIGLLLPRSSATASDSSTNLNGKAEPFVVSPWVSGVSVGAREMAPVVGAEGRF